MKSILFVFLRWQCCRPQCRVLLYILGEVRGGLLSRGRRGETAAACCHVGTDSESRREISNALVSPCLLDFFLKTTTHRIYIETESDYINAQYQLFNYFYFHCLHLVFYMRLDVEQRNKQTNNNVDQFFLE